MAKAGMILTFSHRWIQKEPDGQRCMICDDRCYLFGPWAMEVTVNPGAHMFETDQVVCGACLDDANTKGSRAEERE